MGVELDLTNPEVRALAFKWLMEKAEEKPLFSRVACEYRNLRSFGLGCAESVWFVARKELIV